MQAERVRLDRSVASTVACCSCGWRDVYGDPRGAATAGARHLAHAHAQARRAENLIRRNVRGH